MPTFTALTTLTGKAQAEALVAAMETLQPEPTGVGIFEIEDGSGLWEIGGYFTEAPDEIALALLAAAHGARAFAISELPETDWVAKVKRELAPLRAGRFYLYGSHDADHVPSDVEPLLSRWVGSVGEVLPRRHAAAGLEREGVLVRGPDARVPEPGA